MQPVMWKISNCFTSASQKTTLLRAPLLAPVLPVLLLHTSGPAHSMAWVPNLVHNATTRLAAENQPATSPLLHSPVIPLHLPPSPFLHSVHPPHFQVSPRLFTPTMAKPCHRLLLLDMLSGPAALNRLDLLCSRGSSRLKSFLEFIMLIRSRTLPGGTHWKCHFMVKGSCWVTLK